MGGGGIIRGCGSGVTYFILETWTCVWKTRLCVMYLSCCNLILQLVFFLLFILLPRVYSNSSSAHSIYLPTDLPLNAHLALLGTPIILKSAYDSHTQPSKPKQEDA